MNAYTQVIEEKKLALIRKREDMLFKYYVMVYDENFNTYICHKYDPLFSLGTLLPSKFKKMNKFLKKKMKFYNPKSLRTSNTLLMIIFILLILISLYFFVKYLIKFAKEGKGISILIMILIVSVGICILSFTWVFLDSKFTRNSIRNIRKRKESLEENLEKFRQEDSLLKELNFITFQVSEKGSFFFINFGNEFYQRARNNSKRPLTYEEEEEEEKEMLGKAGKRSYYRIPEINVPVGGKVKDKKLEEYQRDGRLNYPVPVAEKIPFEGDV